MRAWLRHIGKIAHWWWVLVGSGWSFFWVADAAIEKWGTLATKTWWDSHTLRFPANWQVWLIGLLVIAVLLIAQGSYRYSLATEASHKIRLGELERFKRQVEDREVQLSLLRCNHFPSVQQFQRVAEQPMLVRPIGTFEAVTVTFGNHRPPGLPGKVAESVLAKIRYSCPGGRSFEINGRWNELSPPAGPFSSTLDLLRITFNPGDEHHLDIAGKFPSTGLYAYNNDSALAPCHPDRELIGSPVSVVVHLIAQHVDQTFEFELRNAGICPLELVCVPQAR